MIPTEAELMEAHREWAPQHALRARLGGWPVENGGAKMRVPWLISGGTTAVLAVVLCNISLGQRSKPEKLPTEVSIELAGETLRSGMTKPQVAEKLIGTQVKKVDDDNWEVARSEDWLQFTHGLLSFAERHWTDSSSESTDRSIAGDLFYAVQSLNQNDGLSQCTIKAGTDDSPSLTKKWVSINCGQKNILVFKRTFGGHTYDIAVNEELVTPHKYWGF